MGLYEDYVNHRNELGTELFFREHIVDIGWLLRTLDERLCACVQKDKFVAVASGDKAAYSTNGITWVAATLPSSASWSRVCYGSENA